MTTSMPPKGSSTRDRAAARTKGPGSKAPGATGANAEGSTRDWSTTSG